MARAYFDVAPVKDVFQTVDDNVLCVQQDMSSLQLLMRLSRVLKISLDVSAEAFSLDQEFKSTDHDSLDSIFSCLKESHDPVVPFMLLARCEPGATTWSLVAYTPDTAPVREKMLYASSRTDLKQKLGSTLVTVEFYASDLVLKQVCSCRIPR